MAHFFAGTSGFAYPTWKPDFYPAKLPQKDFLKHYASRLNAVEINYTFRQLPSQSTIENWIAATPDTFRFALKAHQKITHILRLRDTEFAQVFFRAIDVLRVTKRLGPVLFQLPPNFKADAALLESFAAALPTDVRCAFEFRNVSWLADETYRVLEKFGISLCLAESDKLEIPHVFTAPFVYSRLRKEDYSPEERTEIRQRAADMLAAGRDVYLFFKHEDTPAGALYAEEIARGLPEQC